MKNIIAIFLLFIMSISVAAPLVEQLYGKVVCEMKEKDDNDGDEDEKDEKEVKKEKEIYAFGQFIKSNTKNIALCNIKSSFLIKNDQATYQNFSALPKLPPELGCFLPMA